MSKRAEQAALKAYPEDWVAGYFDDPDEVTDDNTEAREYFQQGYEQAEKDLALTREDVKKIEDLCMEITTLFALVGRNKVILEPPFYEEVARRFNEQRKK